LPERELTNASAVILFEKGLDVQAERELDGFAGSPRRRDDDDASRRRISLNEGVAIGREIWREDWSGHGRG
jgi:hypothetical protein